MNESEKIDPRELSPLALAFVGDSVLELLVRQRLVEHHRLSAGKLNAAAGAAVHRGRTGCVQAGPQRQQGQCGKACIP